MNNKIIKRVIGYIVVGVAIVTIGVVAYVSTNKVDLKQVVDKVKNIVTKGEEDMHTTDVKVVPSLLDKVGKDYSWCATFQLVWNNMMNEAEEYGGRVHLGERDTFKAPHINFNVKREYKEFENKQ